MEDVVYWLPPHGLLTLLSYATQAGISHSGPSYIIVKQDIIDLPTGQSVQASSQLRVLLPAGRW